MTFEGQIQQEKQQGTRHLYESEVKVGRTNNMGQERSNWTYCQYKGHLTNIKETHEDILSNN